MNARILFQKDKDLAHWLHETIHSDNWEKCRIHALALMAEDGRHELFAGANAFTQTLTELCGPSEPGFPEIFSGLHHDLDTRIEPKIKPKH